jgi:hypothetical protein
LFLVLSYYEYDCHIYRLDSELRRWIGVDLDSEKLTQQSAPELKSLGELLLPLPTTELPSRKFKPKRKVRM